MKKFNIRVYGVLLLDGCCLLSHELVLGKRVTKFTGGGLEWGEGTVECLQREFMEEIGLPITVKRHMYTTDLFQQSLFNEEDQLISIYYEVCTEKSRAEIEKGAKEFRSHRIADREEEISFIPIRDLTDDIFTFPLDRKVFREYLVL